MFQSGGEAAKTVLLSYITLSPLQVPLTAYDNEHYKVSWFSTLNTISPLFPIFVGGLLTVSEDSKAKNKVSLDFSLSAYIGIIVSLLIYSFSLPLGYPNPHRRLPRQFYSMADLMAMCHQSRFLSSPHLNITDRKRTPTKAHMEARILLSGDEFLFGIYDGRDGKAHLGFDVAKKTDVDGDGRTRSTGLVQWIEPAGKAWLYSSRGREYTKKINTIAMEAGKGGYTPANQGYFADEARRIHGEEGGGVEMQPTSRERNDGGAGGGRRRVDDASASGSEQYMMSGAFSRTNTVTFADRAVIPSP